ncbi:MAG: outer membrane beta-barrel domain-containing protein [Bdellovibrionales bacterium]|nr:outer membrane beta-barrel domain-containing protein [Bdellovibrionales bacterium]
MNLVSNYLYLFLAVIFATPSYADTIEFPEDELASESVLPVFDKLANVKNRNVVTEKRIELGGGFGFNLMDPFYNPLNFHGSVSYHFDEIHGVNLAAAFWQSGLSSYGEQLRKGEGLDGDYFDASRAPHPKYMFMANYQYTAYYGKISYSKKLVMNLSMFSLAGVGMIGLDDQSVVALNVGVGEKFYFTPNLALRLDLRALIYRGPDPTTKRLLPTDPIHPSSAFDEGTFIHALMTLALVYLL